VLSFEKQKEETASETWRLFKTEKVANILFMKSASHSTCNNVIDDVLKVGMPYEYFL
jgi:hypothetical protein